jgi:hypothetical protein
VPGRASKRGVEAGRVPGCLAKRSTERESDRHAHRHARRLGWLDGLHAGTVGEAFDVASTCDRIANRQVGTLCGSLRGRGTGTLGDAGWLFELCVGTVASRGFLTGFLDGGGAGGVALSRLYKSATHTHIGQASSSESSHY